MLAIPDPGPKDELQAVAFDNQPPEPWSQAAVSRVVPILIRPAPGFACHSTPDSALANTSVRP